MGYSYYIIYYGLNRTLHIILIHPQESARIPAMSISRVYKIINDVDELVYIGSTKCELSKRMAQHRRDMRKANRTSKLYGHMRANGVEHYKILLIKEYTDISKDRLRNREDKSIKRYDSAKNGLNTYEMGGYYCSWQIERYCTDCEGPAKCIHEKIESTWVECKSHDICIHDKLKRYCIDCEGAGICIHEKQKGQCKICSPAPCDRCGGVCWKR